MLNGLRNGRAGLLNDLRIGLRIGLRNDLSDLRGGFLTCFFKRILNATAGNKAPPRR